MKWTSCAAGLSGIVALWSIGLMQLVAQTGPVNGAASNTELNATVCPRPERSISSGSKLKHEERFCWTNLEAESRD